jgi:flagellar hook-associated protein 3 FlgL
MRITSMMPDVQYGIQQSETSLQTALQQLTTGKRVNQLSDDPAASAAYVRSQAASAQVDQYSSNISSLLPKMQTADSALSNVVTLLNQAITLGTEGANGGLTDANRSAIATQVSSVLSSVVSQANLTYQGSYIFGGSANATAPFTADSSTTGYAYNGNSTVNQVQVGDSLSVASNLPGNQIFTSGANVLGSLNSLVTALQSGSSTDIGTATAAVSNALQYVDQQRAPLDSSINQMNTQETYLSTETVTLTSQQNSLVGIDIATAATNLAQAQSQNSAVLAAAAKVLPQTLLDYLK